MNKVSLSLKIYIGLIITLAILAAIYVFLPQGAFLPTQTLPASKPVLALANAAIMLILYGGLGFLGLKLSSKLDFALGHFLSVMILFDLNTIQEIPSVLISEIILLNGVISIFAAYYFRKYGFLAAVGIHFWTDIIWHVIWGMIY